MIIAHLDNGSLEAIEIKPENMALLKNAVWIDLLNPNLEEENAIERLLDLDIPTRKEMAEIELSNRLHHDEGALFMTALIISHSDTLEPRLDPISFVLTETQLITVRYVTPETVDSFMEKLKKYNVPKPAPRLLVDLITANVNRLADILEKIGLTIDSYSQQIFAKSTQKTKINYSQFMQQIGLHGDLNTKVCESLLTFNRLIPYFLQKATPLLRDTDTLRLNTMHNDVVALSEHANFLANKITFLLDAILGLVNIEQSNIIKLFSVAAVIFLPPTLIASIYGMNFKFMPELSWKFGYALAIGMMILAAWLPYKYFKYRKWL